MLTRQCPRWITKQTTPDGRPAGRRRACTAPAMENFRRQSKAIGLSHDWSREFATSDPRYFKWTQWIFLRLFERGLAYQANVPINWCPSCRTGLANEEVHNGRCER